MKLNKYIIALGAAAVMLGASSCVDDLNVDPNDPKLEGPGMFPSDPDAYMDRVMGDVYLQFSTYGVNGDNTLTSMDGGRPSSAPSTTLRRFRPMNRHGSP